MRLNVTRDVSQLTGNHRESNAAAVPSDWPKSSRIIQLLILWPEQFTVIEEN